MGSRLVTHPSLRLAAAAVALAGAGLAASVAQTRQGDPAPAQRKSEQSASGRPWHFRFDEMVFNDATKEGEATDVVATSEEGDTVIRADVFRWNERTKKAQATGKLRISDDKTDGSADRVDIDYAKSKRTMVLTGNIQITLKPSKPAAKTGSSSPAAGGSSSDGKQEPASNDPTAEARQYPIEVTCERVEYEYARDKKHATMTGSFRAVQKLKDHTRTLTADRAEWFGREDKAILKGPVRLEDTKGRKGETDEDVVIYTKEGQEAIKLRKGVYTMPIEDEDSPGQAAPPEKGLPTAKPSGSV